MPQIDRQICIYVHIHTHIQVGLWWYKSLQQNKITPTSVNYKPCSKSSPVCRGVNPHATWACTPFFFSLGHGILVPRAETEPSPLQRKLKLLTTGKSGKSLSLFLNRSSQALVSIRIFQVLVQHRLLAPTLNLLFPQTPRILFSQET